MRNRTVPYFIASMLVTLVGLPVWAADNASDEQTLRNAATVLHAMLDSKDVPASGRPIALSFCPA